jgi:hypothetical protein
MFAFSRLDPRGYITCAAGPLHSTDSPASIPTLSGRPGKEDVKIEGPPGLESDVDHPWFVFPCVKELWGVDVEAASEHERVEHFVLTLVDDETTQHPNQSGVMVGDVIGFLHHSDSIDKIHLKPTRGDTVEGSLVLSGIDRNGSAIGISLFAES